MAPGREPSRAIQGPKERRRGEGRSQFPASPPHLLPVPQTLQAAPTTSKPAVSHLQAKADDGRAGEQNLTEPWALQIPVISI